MCILQVVKTQRSITMSEEEVMGGGYHQLRAYEPTNCDDKGKIIPSSEGPYQNAKKFIKEDTKRNCCNVGRDKSVQKWHLQKDKLKVHVKKAADSGTILFYHDDLLGSEDFPH